MSTSFQNEIPKARVNITLDVKTNGASQKKELPMKLLMLGNFSNHYLKQSLADRERLSVNQNNFNQIMANISPSIEMLVPNTTKPRSNDLNISLIFKSIKDFQPEQVAMQIPELKRLIAIRNLLKDLKANLLDNKNFRRELAKIITNKKIQQALLNQLQASAPLD